MGNDVIPYRGVELNLLLIVNLFENGFVKSLEGNVESMQIVFYINQFSMLVRKQELTKLTRETKLTHEFLETKRLVKRDIWTRDVHC